MRKKRMSWVSMLLAMILLFCSMDCVSALADGISFSKKGIQGWYEPGIGASQVLFNLDLSYVFSDAVDTKNEKDGIYKEDSYFVVSNKKYSYHTWMLQDYARQIASLRENYGVDTIYGVILAPQIKGITMDVKDVNPAYYALDTKTQTGRKVITQVMKIIGSYLGEDVSYWIIGNEVNDSHTYYESGTSDINTYVTYYEKAMRICYNEMKSYNPDTGVLVSLDHVWNWDAYGRFNAKSLLTLLNTKIKTNGDFNWGVAYHPYPEPLASSNYWNDDQMNAIDSEDSLVITLKNMKVLTDFMNKSEMKRNGKIRPVAITECGFNAYEGDVEDQKQQAAAFARAYYETELNPDIIGFVIRAYQDNAVEAAGGFNFGLLRTDGTKREIYNVFKYIDTQVGKSMVDSYKSVFGTNNWNNVVPGYDSLNFTKKVFDVYYTVSSDYLVKYSDYNYSFGAGVPFTIKAECIGGTGNKKYQLIYQPYYYYGNDDYYYYDYDEVILSDYSSSSTITATIPDRGYGYLTINVKDDSGEIKTNQFYAEFNFPFKDVSTDNAQYSMVEYSYDHNLVKGTTSTTFSPYSNITRGQFVTILWRLEGSKKASTNAFSDVKSGAYYASAVNWANENGIVHGDGNGHFMPNDPVTREQIMTILNNYARFKKYDTKVTQNKLSECKDYQSVSSYAVPSMSWGYNRGLIGANKVLNPKGKSSRIDAVTMLVRFLNYYKVELK